MTTAVEALALFDYKLATGSDGELDQELDSLDVADIAFRLERRLGRPPCRLPAGETVTLRAVARAFSR